MSHRSLSFTALSLAGVHNVVTLPSPAIKEGFVEEGMGGFVSFIRLCSSQRQQTAMPSSYQETPANLAKTLA